MNNNSILGWDIGGAHLKAVLVNENGRAEHVIQRPCPLWQGLEKLEQAIDEVVTELKAIPHRHAVTMTGELADIFPDRASGVVQLAECLDRRFQGHEVVFYAGRDGFVRPEQVQEHCPAIASANWYGSAAFLAKTHADGIFIDIGSTTSDVIVLHSGKPASRGYSDAERLRFEELIYTGVVRTPLMAIARQLPFNGERYSLAAEHFATTADIYRLTGELPEAFDMTETADGTGKSQAESARRLARMIGHDVEDASSAQWRLLAKAARAQQLSILQIALERNLSYHLLPDHAPIIGAGAGNFLARELARLMQRPYIDSNTLILAEDDLCAAWASVCLPAYAVARLQLEEAA